jgi:hypothetical protein
MGAAAPAAAPAAGNERYERRVARHGRQLLWLMAAANYDQQSLYCTPLSQYARTRDVVGQAYKGHSGNSAVAPDAPHITTQLRFT